MNAHNETQKSPKKRRFWCKLVTWWDTWVVPPMPLTPEEQIYHYGRRGL